MVRRTQEQWRELIELQAKSGLSATAFCADHGINAKYFSLRKQQLKQGLGGKKTNFVSVKAPEAIMHPIEIQIGEACIRFPISSPMQLIVDLVRALN